jgi:hypothetical protein
MSISEAAMIEIRPGDFVVDVGRYLIDVHEVTRVSPQCFWRKSSFGKRAERRQDRSGVVFAGPEAVAKRLMEQLVSSRAQEQDEKQRASLRRAERDKKFIAEATGTS